MARVPKQITGNAGAFDAIKKGGKEFKEVGAGKITHFNNGKKAPLKEDIAKNNLSAKQIDDLNNRAFPPGMNVDRWYREGGTVKYDPATNVYTLGKPATVGPHAGKHVEVPYRYDAADGRYYPDFDKYTVETVDISNMTGKNDIDFSQANEALKQKNPDLFDELNQPGKRLMTKDGRGTANSPSKVVGDHQDQQIGYTWHHSQDGKSMVLVDAHIHALFKHYGGASKSRSQ